MRFVTEYLSKGQNPLRDKHSRTGKQGNGEQALSLICCNDGYDEPCKRGVYACGGVQDCWEGHGGKTGIGYIIETLRECW